MTEEEWVKAWKANEDFGFLFGFLNLRAKPSHRKYRLFVVGCCRSIWNLITDPDSLNGIEMLEQAADDGTNADTIRAIHRNLEEKYHIALREMGEVQNSPSMGIKRKSTLSCDILGLATSATEDELDEVSARDVVDSVMGLVAHSAIPPELWDTQEGDLAAEEAILRKRSHVVQVFRCVFGNPFLHISVDPSVLSWDGGIIPTLAQTTYNDASLPDGTLDRSHLAVLADALEDAGCTNGEILDHCRIDGSHVRGCWVLDLLLGKT